VPVEVYPWEKWEEEERKRRNRSIALTLLITVLLALSGFIVLWRDTVPPGNQVQYRTVGAVDFGNQQEGSKNINTQAKPSPQPKPKEKQQQQPTESKAEKVVTQEESPVKTPEASEEKTKTQSTEQEPEESMEFQQSGGSNQGDQPGQTGNAGKPTAKTFSNGKGGYKFGDMKGMGFYGDGPQMPAFDVEEEGQVKYRLTISPEGVVTQVEVVRNNGNVVIMKNRTIEKLRRTRFTNPSNRSVTITTTWTYKAR
jgi:outer membrane biosynthesis protein TonB